jgi:hypothetical protein
MIDSMYFITAVGERMDWNTDPDPNGYFAVEELQFEPEARSNSRNRMQAQGAWPSYTYFGHMLIHINGHILAVDSAHYNAYKLRLMRIIMPIDMSYQAQRHVGEFYVRFTGQAEDFFTEVGLDAAPSISNEALFPSVAPIQLTLKSFFPYMIGAATGKYYWVA